MDRLIILDGFEYSLCYGSGVNFSVEVESPYLRQGIAEALSDFVGAGHADLFKAVGFVMPVHLHSEGYLEQTGLLLIGTCLQNLLSEGSSDLGHHEAVLVHLIDELVFFIDDLVFFFILLLFRVLGLNYASLKRPLFLDQMRGFLNFVNEKVLSLIEDFPEVVKLRLGEKLAELDEDHGVLELTPLEVQSQ